MKKEFPIALKTIMTDTIILDNSYNIYITVKEVGSIVCMYLWWKVINLKFKILTETIIKE